MNKGITCIDLSEAVEKYKNGDKKGIVVLTHDLPKEYEIRGANGKTIEKGLVKDLNIFDE